MTLRQLQVARVGHSSSQADGQRPTHTCFCKKFCESFVIVRKIFSAPCNSLNSQRNDHLKHLVEITPKLEWQQHYVLYDKNCCFKWQYKSLSCSKMSSCFSIFLHMKKNKKTKKMFMCKTSILCICRREWEDVYKLHDDVWQPSFCFNKEKLFWVIKVLARLQNKASTGQISIVFTKPYQIINVMKAFINFAN